MASASDTTGENEPVPEPIGVVPLVNRHVEHLTVFQDDERQVRRAMSLRSMLHKGAEVPYTS